MAPSPVHAHARPHFLARYPPWLTRWVGYRPAPPPKRPAPLVWWWSFLGAFAGLSVLQAVFGHTRYFAQKGVTGMVASYGASAVLVFGAIEAPLAQPRAVFGGHAIAALVGLCITKLFALAPPAHFASLRWLAASLSTALALVLMQATETVHPPAGATALLPALDEDVWRLGWYYLPVVLLSSTLILAVALLVNNVQRRYPVYWIRPVVPAVSTPGPEMQGPEPEDGHGASPAATAASSVMEARGEAKRDPVQIV